MDGGGVVSSASQSGAESCACVSGSEIQTQGARGPAMPRARPVIQSFDTARLPQDMRFEGFRLRINSMFDMEALDRADEADFAGAIRSINLGSLLISAMRTREFAFSRSRRRVLSDFIDHVLVRVDLDGAAEAGGRPRQLIVIDLGRVSEPGITPADNVSVVVPRRVLGVSDTQLAALHGRALTTPMALILAEHLVAVMRHAAGVGPDEAEAIAALTPALLAACLAPSPETGARARADLDVVLLGRARASIEASLRDPRLDPALVARATGVSRAALYRLFEPAGGVARAIREARLKQALRDIAAAGPASRIGDIGHALCFSSEAQFSRAFKSFFGFTPREARAAAGAGRNLQALAAGDPDADRVVFPEWLSLL